MFDNHIIIIGGGAAGFFTAINCAEANPNLKVTILERGKKVLSKVKVSGGGRCNVTHAEFIPREFAKNYPRGSRELLGPFHSFCSGDTIEWFENHGVELKIEEDGRMFPTTDNSQTIINCFWDAVRKTKIEVLTGHRVEAIQPPSNTQKYWTITANGKPFFAQKLMIATGSNPKIWEICHQLGHTIVPPVPSLFTFNIKDPRINELQGLSVPFATVKVLGTKLKANGPLLITHWGMSGPAILKLSAWGARILNEKKYNFQIQVNWLGKYHFDEILEELNELKQQEAKKWVLKRAQFNLPTRLWKRLAEAAGVTLQNRWADLNKKKLSRLAAQLTQATFSVKGKSTFKEEFVTAGGVSLKEINFKRFESKIHKNLFFAGEVLDIDAVTGGFNFQAAWTGGWVAAKSIGE